MQTDKKNKAANKPAAENKPEKIQEEPKISAKSDDRLTLIDKDNNPVVENDSQSTGINMMKIDFNAGEMPDLDECEVVPLDLASNYWTPTNLNEKRRAYFVGIKVMDMQSLEDPDVLIELPCAFFYGKEEGIVKGFCNASKVLVSILKQNHIEVGTALEITWIGKKKNTSNSYKSDNWSVKPLMLKLAK